MSRLSLSPASPSSVLPLWPWLLSSAVPREKVFFVFGPWRGFAVGTTFVLCGGCWIRQCVWSRHRSLVPCGVLMTGSPVQTGPHRTGCTCRVFTRKGWLTGWSVFVRRNCRFGYMSHADDLPTKLPQWTSVSCTEQCGDPYAIAHTPAGRPAGLSARPSASPHARRARVRSATAGTRSISSVSTAHAASSRGISAVSTAHIASFGGISAVSSAIFSVLAMRNSPRCSQVYSGV